MTSLIDQLPNTDGILCRVWDDDITEAVIDRVTSFSQKHLEYCCLDKWYKYAVPLNELELACYRQNSLSKDQAEKLDKLFGLWIEDLAAKVLLDK